MSAEEKTVKKDMNMVSVEYLKDHGNYKKGASAKMHKSTAEALVAHKVVKLSAA